MSGKRTAAAGNGFTKIDHDLTRTQAWLALEPGEIATLLHIWSKHNGRNNGDIGLGCREIEDRFGCSSKTAVKWLRGLREKGFIAIATAGSFNRKTGFGRATRWRLTMEPCGDQKPTLEYVKWRPEI